MGRLVLPLPARDTGYGHSTDEVDAVRARPELLLEYYDAVHRQTVEFVQTLGDEDFDRIVDKRFDRPLPSACGSSAPSSTASSTWGRPRTPMD
ncbi:hypothetical protein V3C33_02020 [Micrococcaceae bacterium Sec5.7]